MCVCRKLAPVSLRLFSLDASSIHIRDAMPPSRIYTARAHKETGAKEEEGKKEKKKKKRSTHRVIGPIQRIMDGADTE